MSLTMNEAEQALIRALEADDHESASLLAHALLEHDPTNRDAAYARGMAAWSKKLHDVAKPWLRAGSEGSRARRLRYFQYLYERGDLLELSAEFRRADSGAEDGETRSLKILTGARLGNALLQIHGYRDALDCYRQTVEDIDGALLAKPLAESIGKGLLASADGCGLLQSLMANADRAVRDLFGPDVVGGIFQGMRLPDPFGYVAAAFRIGSYEAECAPVLRAAVAERGYHHVVNIGCAWGYYTVGLARLLSKAAVVAFEADQYAREWAEMLAAANAVADRVAFAGTCTRDTLGHALLRDQRSLVVVDCEGGEVDLLDPDVTPALTHCDLLVECHDFIDPAITPTLLARFVGSHEIQMIEKAMKLPSDFPRLLDLPPIDRWFAVLEARGTESLALAACTIADLMTIDGVPQRCRPEAGGSDLLQCMER